MRFRLDIWLLGLPLVAAIAGAATWRIAPEIEAGFRARIQASPVRSEAGQLGRAGARVEVEGRDLVITSDAPLSADGIAEAERVGRSIAGLRSEIIKVLAPASVQPFTFAVKRVREGLVLSGFVPPGGVRAELLDKAGEGGATVRDDLRSALGAPPDFEAAARKLVEAARRLEDASASLSDRTLSVSGTAPDAGAYRAATNEFRSVPPGYSAAKVEITPPLVRPYFWSAAREAGQFVLAGNVPTEAERRALVALAGEAGAGAKVDDRMDTARGLESGLDFDAVARRSLALLGKLEAGRVELRGRNLTIEGRLAARDLLESLQRDIRNARLPGVELDRIDLEPIVPRPYRFTARRRDGRVFLAGFLPRDGDRTVIRELIQRRFPVDAIVDDLHLADGAPDGILPAAQRALERLSTLAEGEAVIEDRKLRLAGRSLYAELAQRTEREFATGLPPGWTAEAAVAAIPNKPLDPDFCRDLVADATRREPIRFETGKDELSPVSRKTLSEIADVMRRCGTARLQVVSTIDTAGEMEPARALAERRAAAIVSVLSAMGARGAVPHASATKLPDAGKASERIAFEVRP
jgi:outer membrane protein OmpA-like peptidoglycan-associated protein